MTLRLECITRRTARQHAVPQTAGSPHVRRTPAVADRWCGERGAILIHVAVAMLGLLAFSAFTIDYGVMMLSRGQGQTAADAAALAAGAYMAWDDLADQPAHLIGCRESSLRRRAVIPLITCPT